MPYIIVAVVRRPWRCAWRMMSIHSSGDAFGIGEHLLADPVGEDLGAAAGDRHQPGLLEARDDVVEAHPLLPGDELDLRRREGSGVDRGIVLAQDVRSRSIVVRERQVGVDAALHQDAGAVERQRLLDLPADLLERQQVALFVPGRAVEGAEPALVDANVGVVDVAVDVVGRDRGVVAAGCAPRSPRARASSRSPSRSSRWASPAEIRRPASASSRIVVTERAEGARSIAT